MRRLYGLPMSIRMTGRQERRRKMSRFLPNGTVMRTRRYGALENPAQAVAGNIQAFIEHNYMDDISLQTVAEAMNYSDAYFCKIFKQCFDKNFIVYLSEYRVARAKELLGDVLINVKDVSQKVGLP